MRDFFFLAILPFMLIPMFKRPFIALGMWIWTAMFFPNAWLYGMGASLRYNLIFTGIAIVGYLALRSKPKFQASSMFYLAILFFVWTSISTVLGIGNSDVMYDIWIRFAKVTLLFVFVVLIVEKKLHLDFFLWCVIFSIGFYGSLEALKFVASGGGHKIAGFAGHALGDRNELALAFVLTLPICGYLLGEYGKTSKYVRLGLLAVMGLLVTAIIGTQSRGGFIALLGLGAYFFVKSDNKVWLTIGVIFLIAALSGLVSDEWTSRMDTIQEAGEDASFMGRVVAWKLSFIMAIQNPLFGGGFKALEFFPVWSNLSRDFFSYSFFYTGEAMPSAVRARAAHSIYFQVLGEHGFAGLAIYLSLLWAGFRTASRVAKKAAENVALTWISSVAKAFQLSLFAFCLGGAALNFAYFEMVFAILALVIVLDKRILPAELAALAAELPIDRKTFSKAPHFA